MPRISSEATELLSIVTLALLGAMNVPDPVSSLE